MFKTTIPALFATTLLLGCSEPGGVTSTVGPEQRTAAATNNITAATIEKCWKRAGIKGDLYKFMTPNEAAGLKAGGIVSQEQADVFQACVRS